MSCAAAKTGYEEYGRQMTLGSNMDYGEASSDDLSSDWEDAEPEPEHTPTKVSRSEGVTVACDSLRTRWSSSDERVHSEISNETERYWRVRTSSYTYVSGSGRNHGRRYLIVLYPTPVGFRFFKRFLINKQYLGYLECFQICGFLQKFVKRQMADN